MSEPRMRRVTRTRRTRRLPQRSASLPEIGVVTAAATRETVSTQAVALRVESSSSGRWFWMGTTRVCMNETLVAATPQRDDDGPGAG